MGTCCTKPEILLHEEKNSFNIPKTEQVLIAEEENYKNNLFVAIIKRKFDQILNMKKEDLKYVAKGLPLIHWMVISAITTKYPIKRDRMISFILSHKKHLNIRTPLETHCLCDRRFLFIIYTKGAMSSRNIENLTVLQFIDELLNYISISFHIKKEEQMTMITNLKFL